MAFYRCGSGGGTLTATKLVDDTFYSSNTSTTFSLSAYTDYKYLIIQLSRNQGHTLTINNATTSVQKNTTVTSTNVQVNTAAITNIKSNSSYSVYGYGTTIFHRLIIGIK